MRGFLKREVFLKFSIILTGLLLMPNVAAQPDLTIFSINIPYGISFEGYTDTYYGNVITEGQNVTINATVYNDNSTIYSCGNASASSILVQFFDGNPDTGGLQIGPDQIISSLANGSDTVVSVTWNTSGKAGEHEIWVAVDPDYSIFECDETNNRAFWNLTVSPQPTPSSEIKIRYRTEDLDDNGTDYDNNFTDSYFSTDLGDELKLSSYDNETLYGIAGGLKYDANGNGSLNDSQDYVLYNGIYINETFVEVTNATNSFLSFRLAYILNMTNGSTLPINGTDYLVIEVNEKNISLKNLDNSQITTINNNDTNVLGYSLAKVNDTGFARNNGTDRLILLDGLSQVLKSSFVYLMDSNFALKYSATRYLDLERVKSVTVSDGATLDNTSSEYNPFLEQNITISIVSDGLKINYSGGNTSVFADGSKLKYNLNPYAQFLNSTIWVSTLVISVPTQGGGGLVVNQTSPACISGGYYWSNITDAVNNASNGDVIYVCNGTYTENVNINKSVNITSVNGSSKTIVNASNPNGHVFYITADGVNISGLTVMGATTQGIAGIFLDGSNNSFVFNNNVTDNYNGIFLYFSSNNTLYNNTANENDDKGIFLELSNYNTLTNNNASSNTLGGMFLSYSNNNALTNNTVSNDNNGIHLEYSNNNSILNSTANSNKQSGIIFGSSNNNTIANNNMSNNTFGIYFYSSSTNNTISNNTAKSNNSGIYLNSSSSNAITNNTVSNSVNGIALVSSSNNNAISSNIVYNISDQGIVLHTASNNVITDNNASSNQGEGFLIMSNSNNNTLSNNIANSNGQGGGIALLSSINNTITNNTASNNSAGISLNSSTNNTITNNTANSNNDGIYIAASSTNTIYHNNIINNTNQAFDDGSNTWDNGYSSGGNYWSDWTSPDSNGDGVVDYLYSIAGGENEDRYPLTKENGWLNVTPLSTEPPVTTIITGNVTANQTKIIDARNQTNTYIELLPETNSTFNITVGTATNTSSVNATSMTSAYGIAQNQKSLDEFVKIELSGEKINSTANLSWVYIRVYYADADLDKNGDGDADDPGDINENALKLYWYWPEGNKWMPVNTGNTLVSKGGPVVYDTDTNKTENYIWANLSHFSVYGVAGDVVPEPSPTPSGGGGGGASKPKIIILANSIDYNLSGNFTAFLKGNGIEIIYTTPENFSEYNKNKFIVVLGGPDAYEGVGEIVREVLNESEQDYLRIKGNRKMYVKTNVWKSYGQVVMIIAGSDREETGKVCEEEKLEVKKKVKGS